MFPEEIWVEIISHLELDACINLLVVSKITGRAFLNARNKVSGEDIYKYRDTSRIKKHHTEILPLFRAGHKDLASKIPIHYFSSFHYLLEVGGRDRSFILYAVERAGIELIRRDMFVNLCKRDLMPTSTATKWIRNKLEKKYYEIIIKIKYGDPKFYLKRGEWCYKIQMMKHLIAYNYLID